MDKITIERETLERAIADYDSAAGNDGTLLSWNRARDNLLALLRAALAAQPAEPVAWRWKERVNSMSDSDWTVTNVEPPDGVRVIAKEPLYAAQPAPAAVPPGYALVPIEPTPEMVAAYLNANDEYWKRADELPPSLFKWRNGTPKDATVESYHAMIAAAGDKP